MRYCPHFEAVILIHKIIHFNLLQSLGQLKPNIVEMFVEWSQGQVFCSDWNLKWPQCAKMGVFCFCIWTIYFSPNFGNLVVHFYKQNVNRFCMTLPFQEIWQSKWVQHPKVLTFILSLIPYEISCMDDANIFYSYKKG